MSGISPQSDQSIVAKIRQAAIDLGKEGLFHGIFNFAPDVIIRQAPQGQRTSNYVSSTHTISLTQSDLSAGSTRLFVTFVHEMAHAFTVRSVYLPELRSILGAPDASPTNMNTLNSIILWYARVEVHADLITYHWLKGTSGYLSGLVFGNAIDKLYADAGGDLTDNMIINHLAPLLANRRFVDFSQRATTTMESVWRGQVVGVRAAEEYNSPAALGHLMRLLVNFDLAHQNRLDPFANTNVPDWVKNAFRIHTPNNPYGPSIQA
jgi:hypothetical protein